MKNWIIIVLCICLAVSVTACSQRGDINESEISQSQSTNTNPSIQSEQEANSEGAVSSDDEIPLAYNADSEKYYDYFNENSHVSMLLGNETGGKGFSDAEMASYALCEIIKINGGIYDSEVGSPKEDVDTITEKYFGATIQNYENKKSTVISETGNITSTGWGGTSIALVLKELKKELDGTLTGVFYLFGFGMDEYQSSTKDDLLRGLFESYGQPSLITIVFEEKTDENGVMYLRYYEVKSEGEAKPPYELYQG